MMDNLSAGMRTHGRCQYTTSRPLTIVSVFNRYRQAGGEEHSVDRIARHLQSAGHRVLPFRRSSEDWLGPDAPARIVQPFLMFHNRDVLNDLCRLQAEEKADLWMLHNVIPVISFGVYGLAARLGVPVFQWMHNYRPVSPGGSLDAGGKLLNVQDRRIVLKEVMAGSWRNSRLQTGLLALGFWLCRKRGDFDAVRAWIAVSRGMRQVLSESSKLPADRLYDLRHAWDVEPDRAEHCDRGAFLFLGRTLTTKGIDFLVDIFADPRLQDCRLIVAGDGDDRARCERRSSANVEWVGWVTGAEKKKLLSGCRALLFPSLWPEPLGLIAYEAYQEQKPVLGSGIGGITEIIQDRSSGRVLAPGSRSEWIDAILELHQNPGLAQEWGAWGYSWLQKSTSPDKWNEAFDAIVASALGPGSKK